MSYISACGSAITKAHYHRNTAKVLLEKKLGMSAEAKAARIFQAREQLTMALEATSEGQELLARSEVQSLRMEPPHRSEISPTSMSALIDAEWAEFANTP